MNLADRTILIERMIRENSDATIKKYLELVKEFDEIRALVVDKNISILSTDGDYSQEIPADNMKLVAVRKRKTRKKLESKYLKSYKMNFFK